jgi:beta-N-acetylhexosaminidase
VINALISGCAGHVLTKDEIAFFREINPWGLILFKRNIDTPEQVKALTASFRDVVGRANAPVLIDQEGGRVQRMGPPHWPRYVSARTFLAINDSIHRREVVRLSAQLMASDLKAVGITVDCLPVMDVPIAGAHDVIGNRAYAEDPMMVASLGRATMEGVLAAGVLPVMKHIPGHGRAMVDSHLHLPTVAVSLETLRAHDFLPFQHLTDCPAAMTAHVVYEAIDPKAPGTVSRKVIQSVIRKEIGFDGLLMSDDLSMKALGGSFESRTDKAYAAGCDLVLHCNGVMEEMKSVASRARPLAGAAMRRAKAALGRISHRPEPIEPVEAREALAQALAGLAGT